ncbi:HNH endonuclease signature motif containing protein [Paenibacillus sp. PK4536]|uniref:HNH endonuclease signature motif containing protein n=1 Tax=Paenibacillus sp. PK4536 TaxID=3024576 RepID=UPI00235A0808|nr:HNH endonuclease signature motif containing protein [Paenibacillus sp. PK4536]WIM41389.1 HNH endonuclease signature motif containing protein [Paenibacillus sp. PK4536]
MHEPIDIRFSRLLIEEYHSQEVIALYKKNSALYGQIYNHCRGLQISVKDYIHQLGFKVIRNKQTKKENAQEESLNEDEQKSKLKSHFPLRNIESISQIQDKDYILYTNLKAIASLYDLNVTNLLLSWNYKIGSSSIFDFLTLKKLKELYNFQATEFSEWFGVSRQRIDQLLKKEGMAFPFWVSSYLNENDIVKINELMTKKTTFSIENEGFIKLYRSKDFNLQKFAVFIKNEESTRCIFDIPSWLRDNLLSLNYHLLDEIDFELIRSVEDEELNEDRSFTEDEVEILKKRLKKFNKNHTAEYDLEQLIEFYQIKNRYIKVIDRRFVSEDEIKKLIVEHYNEKTGFVKVPIETPYYQRLVQLAHNRGLNLKGLIEAHGFLYEKIRNIPTKERIKERIDKNYLINNKFVYISSYDPFYQNLYLTLRRKQENITDFLLIEYGYTRIFKEDLPENYLEFNWRNMILNLNKEEEYIAYIEENLLFENEKVYINSQSPFYAKLFIYANQYKLTINEQLKIWGFEREYNPYFNSEETNDNVSNEKVQKDVRSELLNEIKKIQGQLDITSNTRIQIQRSKILVEKMKVLYLDGCQLCENPYSNPTIPRIEMENGRHYIEVHHIKPISNALHANDESDVILDSYLNLVVVCAHHHKLLHYAGGGFDFLTKIEDEKLVFESVKGEKLLIFTNYHLEVKD